MDALAAPPAERAGGGDVCGAVACGAAIIGTGMNRVRATS